MIAINNTYYNTNGFSWKYLLKPYCLVETLKQILGTVNT